MQFIPCLLSVSLIFECEAVGSRTQHGLKQPISAYAALKYSLILTHGKGENAKSRRVVPF